MKPLKIHRKKTQGMTFIEVLVALVIMVTGILGAVAMQATAKKGSFDAMQRSLASSLAQDIIERMRSNDSNALAGYGKLDYGTGAYSANKVASCATAAGCSAASMLANDQYEWELALMGADVKNGSHSAGGLIDTRACIKVNNNAVTVVITWQGHAQLKAANGGLKECSSLTGERRQVLVEAFIY